MHSLTPMPRARPEPSPSLIPRLERALSLTPALSTPFACPEPQPQPNLGLLRALPPPPPPPPPSPSPSPPPPSPAALASRPRQPPSPPPPSPWIFDHFPAQILYLPKQVTVKFSGANCETVNFPDGLHANEPPLVLVFQDEAAFHGNDDCPYEWCEEGRMKLRPKSRGSLLMVSEFLSELGGRLMCSEGEAERYAAANPGSRIAQKVAAGKAKDGIAARLILEPGANKDKYFDNEQVHRAKFRCLPPLSLHTPRRGPLPLVITPAACNPLPPLALAANRADTAGDGGVRRHGSTHRAAAHGAAG